jgi:hypothetical protein
MRQKGLHQDRPEIILNVLAMILGLLVVGLSWQLGLGSLAKPGTGLAPLLAGGVIFISALSLILFQGKTQPDISSFHPQEKKTYLLMTVVFMGWMLALPLLGYISVTFLATFSLAKIMKIPGRVRPFLLSIGTTLFCYFLFDFWLYMDLPRGILG